MMGEIAVRRGKDEEGRKAARRMGSFCLGPCLIYSSQAKDALTHRTKMRLQKRDGMYRGATCPGEFWAVYSVLRGQMGISSIIDVDVQPEIMVLQELIVRVSV
jgi:hypothetical protein